MKAPNHQSFGAARAVTNRTDYSDGHIQIKIQEADGEAATATLTWFGVPVMVFKKKGESYEVTGSFCGWPDSGKLRQMMNSMLMRLGIHRRVGLYRGAPYLYSVRDGLVQPITRVSPCEPFTINNPEDDE